MNSCLEEALIQAEKKFGPNPTFLYGSRANGGYTEKSDWDICVLGDRHKFLEIGKDIDIACINSSDIGKSIAANMHGDVTGKFARGLIPLRGERQVSQAEKYVKLNIANYVAKKTKSKSQDMTGKDVMLHYFSEEAKYNPAFKSRLIKFLKTDNFKEVAEQYDRILEENDLPLPATYCPMTYSNILRGLAAKSMIGIAKRPVRTLNTAKKIILEYPKCAFVDLKLAETASS